MLYFRNGIPQFNAPTGTLQIMHCLLTPLPQSCRGLGRRIGGTEGKDKDKDKENLLKTVVK